MTLEKAELVDDLVPADGLAVWSVRLVVYIDEDGQEKLGWETDGEPSTGDVLGALELFKLDVQRDWIRELVGADEEEDD